MRYSATLPTPTSCWYQARLESSIEIHLQLHCLMGWPSWPLLRNS
uniref:Uncharacterized protein n=1 Tax=Arundo donax TaxID=35708 RepID=A0A0A8ZRS6_ARUDO